LDSIGTLCDECPFQSPDIHFDLQNIGGVGFHVIAGNTDNIEVYLEVIRKEHIHDGRRFGTPGTSNDVFMPFCFHGSLHLPKSL
jgi:hypothetical protein